MADAKKQIVWLDMQDAGYRLFLDDQSRMVLDEITTPAPEETKQALIDMGFEETQSGFSTPYTALAAYGLSKVPGARPVEMGREMINIGYRKVLLENTQAFVQEIIDNPDTEVDPAAAEEQEIGDFLDDLAGTETNEAVQEDEMPEEPEPEVEDQAQVEDPTPILGMHDVAVFKPYKKTLRTDIGMVSEVIRNTRNQVGYHIVAQDDDGPRSQRVWEGDYDIQTIDTGFSWNAPEGQKEVVGKEGDVTTGFVFRVSVANQSAGTYEHETVKAEDIGTIIQKDQYAFESQKDEPEHAENETPAEKTKFDAFIKDIPEPRKSRIAKALSEVDATGLTRWATIENYVVQGFSIAANEENNRKKRGLVSPDGQFMDGFTKTELDYVSHLLSMESTQSVSPETYSADLNTLREKARALGLEKEADILWLNKDALGLEKLISDKGPEVPWEADEQFRILNGISFQTPSQKGSPDKTLGERVLLKDYPGFEFVVYPDPNDSEAVIFSEYSTGMRITTNYDRSMDSAVQKGLAALKKNTPEPFQLGDLVDGKQINVAPERAEDPVLVASTDNRQGIRDEDAPGYILTEITFKDISQISAQDLLSLIRTEDLESQGYRLTMGDLMAEVSLRMKAGTFLEDLGWPDDPESIYVNRQTGEKREFQVLGHGYSFFEKFNPEGLEDKPAEESQDQPRVSFDEQKQELRREYSDRGYALYFKVSDESWNLTNKQTRTVGATEYMAGDIALSLRKEDFLNVDACIDRFESLFSTETSQTEAGEPELNPGQTAESVPDDTPEAKSKPAILPYKEQFGSGAAKNVGKLLNDLGIAQDVAASKDYYARIENGEYMDLVIEKHSDELFLAHYYEQNGDLIMDNELVFKVNEETGHLIFKEVALQNPRGGEIRAHDKGFANMFAKNLVQQGFGQGKILHTTMSETNRMQEEEVQTEPEDIKNESWQDYLPGQLPYYELGGKAIDVEDIEPYAFQEDEDGNVSMTNFFPGNAPSDPQVILEKLMRYKATEEKNLEHYVSKYKDVAEKGIEAVNEEDRQDMSDDKAVATALFLEHSHIAYSKGYLAAIDAALFEIDAQQNIPDTQKENIAAAPGKIAFTDKSVSDNIQRAVLDKGEIEIINKSGRKIVSRKTFPLAKWESLSKSFGNPEYNKREFVKSLGLIETDGTPESDSLKQRIIDSQVKAIDTVYGEWQSMQAPQEAVEENPADNILPDGWSESPGGGMITNEDPISGGIIDREIVSGKWFVIPENDRIKKLEGFDTRAEAHGALVSQVSNLSNVMIDFDPTTPENYADIMSDTALQDEYQDTLDSLFNTRIIDVRNALRDIGWEGEQYKDLCKHGEPLKIEPIPVKSVNNIIGYSVNGIRDDLTKTPELFAKEIDEKHNLNFHEAAKKSRIGFNLDGVEIHQAENGNRYLLDDGTKTSAPMALSPDRSMKAYSPKDHFKNGRTQFLTSEELAAFAKPAKIDFPSIDEIPVDTSMFFTGDEINLRRLLMTGGLSNDPEKTISLIERKMRLTAVSFDADAKKLREMSSQPDPNEEVLGLLIKSISESKSRLEVLLQARDEQNQLLDEQQTIRM